MKEKDQKPYFDISAYQEQKKRAEQEIADLRKSQNELAAKYEKSRKISIISFISAIGMLLATGLLDLMLRNTSSGTVIVVTILKTVLLVGILFATVLLLINAPNCVAIRKDGNWYRYPQIYQKLEEALAEARKRLEIAENTIASIESVDPAKELKETLPVEQAMEDGSFFGRREALLEEDEEGDLVISMEEALKSLEDDHE